ncbi:MAG TPA: erythromycin esterase family protein [Chitinophagaceae bacterium]|jgi:erythromycin esterase-like protein|nr:erythromycin esterase family protein [Chitinophagaceae bacterium]
MKKCLTICLTIVSALSSVAQEKISEYIQKNTTAITHVDPVKDDFADLAAIGNAIGNARIVMLGEQDHGDGPAFLAKSRLIKYLHEEKGFNVLAFESDVFALNTGWDRVVKASPMVDSFLKKNIFPIWTYCDACEYLFYKYIPSTQSTKKPLIITGFDNQVILPYSEKNLPAYIDSSWRALELPVTKRPDYNSRILPLITEMLRQYYKRMERKEIFDQALGCLDTIRQEIAVKTQPGNYDRLIADNLYYLAKELKLVDDRIASNEARDEQMTRNMEWLAKQKFPNEKIIVWAANGHVIKYTDSLKDGFMFVNMGTRFVRDPELRSQTYVLGFTSGEGKAGRLTVKKTYNVASVKKNSVESWMNGSAYSFIDLNPYNAQYPLQRKTFWMKGYSHYYREEQWNRAFDGVFYIREMYPCKRIE